MKPLDSLQHILTGFRSIMTVGTTWVTETNGDIQLQWGFRGFSYSLTIKERNISDFVTPQYAMDAAAKYGAECRKLYYVASTQR